MTVGSGFIFLTQICRCICWLNGKKNSFVLEETGKLLSEVEFGLAEIMESSIISSLSLDLEIDFSLMVNLLSIERF